MQLPGDLLKILNIFSIKMNGQMITMGEAGGGAKMHWSFNLYCGHKWKKSNFILIISFS